MGASMGTTQLLHRYSHIDKSSSHQHFTQLTQWHHPPSASTSARELPSSPPASTEVFSSTTNSSRVRAARLSRSSTPPPVRRSPMSPRLRQRMSTALSLPPRRHTTPYGDSTPPVLNVASS